MAGRRSYLTPVDQVVMGGLVLMAGLAWPPLFFIVLTVYAVRLLSRARRGSARSTWMAAGLTMLVAGAATLMAPDFLLIVLAVALGTLTWLLFPRLTGSSRSPHLAAER